jgi:hypothetical protein
MKTASGRSARPRSESASDPASPTPAPSAYSRLVAGQIVTAQSAESNAETRRFGRQHSLLRLTLVRGYGPADGVRRFDALEQIRERLQWEDDRVRAVYSTLLIHVDVAIDRRLLQPLAAQRDTERRRLTGAVTNFTRWYRGHLSGPRTEREQLLPDSLLLQALDTLRAALDQDPLMSTPIDARFKRPADGQRRKDTERARQALCAWGVGKRDADAILKCVGLSERGR